MNWPDLIYSGAMTIVVGIIGFFVKRTIGQVDNNTSEIEKIKKDYATKDDFKDEIRKISNNIDDIKDNYIKKDDFVRSIADTNSRLERIYTYLLEMNGGKRNG